MARHRVAIAGASGTGKTRLAKYIAERLGLPLCPVGSRSVSAEMGFASPYDVDAAGQREAFQRRLFESKRAWECARTAFVSDRTHLDNLAYRTLHAIDSIDDETIESYFAAMAHYTTVFFLPITAFHHIGDDPDRRKERAYHVIFDALLESLLVRAGVRFVALRGHVDLRQPFIDRHLAMTGDLGTR